jgi:transposase
MIALPAKTQIWIAAGVTDLRRGFTGLSALVQTKLEQSPFSGHVFVFRGRRGDLIKVLWFDGDGLCLFAKRLERGRFVWPQATSGAVSLTRAQLSMLLEDIDWRRPERTLSKLSRKSDTTVAIRYALSRWDALTRYIEDGHIEIDNNAAERSLRGVALGRKAPGRLCRHRRR